MMTKFNEKCDWNVHFSICLDHSYRIVWNVFIKKNIVWCYWNLKPFWLWNEKKTYSLSFFRMESVVTLIEGHMIGLLFFIKLGACWTNSITVEKKRYKHTNTDSMFNVTLYLVHYFYEFLWTSRDQFSLFLNLYRPLFSQIT